jgi:ligand-binding SRPBCC domain-containing protein
VYGHHTLVREQRFDGTPDELFPFFADADNLEAITPPWLSFRVITPRPITMQPGTLIEYHLTLHRIPIRWRTRIEEWVPDERFVDVQLDGPYKLWHHTHEFIAAGEHTIMRDTVRYALPLGPIGELAHRFVVAGDLDRIFDFRRDYFAARVPSMPSARWSPRV